MRRLPLLALTLVALLCMQRVRDVDYWWQLTLGKAIAERGPWDATRETWMHTRLGLETHSLSWGYCLGLYAMERLIGPIGIVLVKAAIVVATFAIMAVVAGRRVRGPRGRAVVAAAVVVSALVASQRFVVRPEVVVYLLLAIELWIIDRAAGPGGGAPRHARLLWFLPIIQLLWVNIHSTFVLGLGLIAAWVGIAAAAEAAARFRGPTGSPNPDDGARSVVRRGGVILLLSAAASLASPYIGRVWAVPYRRLLAILPDPSLRVGVAAGAGVVIASVFAAYLLAAPAGRWWRNRGPRSRNLARAARMPLVLAVVVLAAIAVTTWSNRTPAPDVERRAITELASPWGGGSIGSLTAVWWYRVAAVGVTATLLVSPRRWVASRREAFWLVAAITGLVLSSLAVRALALFAILSLPVLAVGLRRLCAAVRSSLGPRPAPSLGSAGRAIVCGCIFYYTYLIVTDRFWTNQNDSGRFGLNIDERTVPRRAAEVLLTAGGRGLELRPFNSERTGGYLLSRGIRVFIDSRAAGNMLPEYLAILEDPRRFDEAARSHRLNAAVIDLINRPLLAHVSRLDDWRLVHLDEQVAVFLRRRAAAWIRELRPSAEAARLLADARAALGGQPSRTPRPWRPARYIGFHVSAAWAFWDLGAAPAARGLLEDAAVLDPARFDDWVLLGQARELGGSDADLEAAGVAYDRAIEQAGTRADWFMFCLSASVELRRGELLRAESRARAAAQLAPDRNEPWQIGLAAAERRADDAAAEWWRSRGNLGNPPGPSGTDVSP